MSTLYWQQMTREELTAQLGSAVVVLPTGATEQHGPHLVTGVDSMLVTDIATRAADLASEHTTVIILPTLPFGSSTHHVPLGGTLTLQSETYYSVIRQVIISVLDAGGSRIFLLNGHGGNHEINQLVARDVVLEFQGMGLTITVAVGSYWNIGASSLAQIEEFQSSSIPGHAGRLETSLMLATHRDGVREPIAERTDEAMVVPEVEGVRFETGYAWQLIDGFTDFPHLASEESGTRAFDAITRDVAAAIVALAESGDSDSRKRDFMRWGAGRSRE